MEERVIESLGHLKDFISVHKLQSRSSLNHFYARVFITTDKVTEQEEEITIMVSFNVFGKAGELTFHNHDLDPKYYPTIFYPNYDDFLHEDKEILKINGFHSGNPLIGKYIIEIHPLGKVKN
jgi:hypothetical protein